METLGDQKRRQLFELYSSNLTAIKQHHLVHIEPDEDEGFICPICFKFFTRESLNKIYDDHLTLEDVPPIALGGKVRTLTCKKCNNWGGSQLESHLKNKLAMDEFLQGITTSWDKALFRPQSDINIPATINIKGGSNVSVEYYSNRAHPDESKKLRELEASQLTEIQFRLIGKHRQFRPEIALLRIAYLWAFSFFGYGFLINHNIQRVREQIKTPLEKLLPNYGILYAEFPDDVLGINIIDRPKELQSFLVVYKLKTKNRTTKHAVVLPGPTDPGLGIYDWLSAPINFEENIQFSIRHICENNYIVNPDLAFASHQLWHEK